MSGCFVLMMEKCLPQRVAGFEVNQDVMFVKDPPVFPFTIRNYVVFIFFCLYNAVLSYLPRQLNNYSHPTHWPVVSTAHKWP